MRKYYAIGALILASVIPVSAQDGPKSVPTATDRWCAHVNEQRVAFEKRVAELLTENIALKDEVKLLKVGTPAKSDKAKPAEPTK
jgi:hypothetical protein